MISYFLDNLNSILGLILKTQIQFGEMQSLYGCIRSVRSHATNSSKVAHFNSVLRKPNSSAGNEVGYVDFVGSAIGCSNGLFFPSLCKFISPSSLELVCFLLDHFYIQFLFNLIAAPDIVELLRINSS